MSIKESTFPPYEGLLNEPIEIASPFPTCAEQAEDWHYVQFSQKMNLLFAHFNIVPSAPGSYMALAIALAERHVTGFQVNQYQQETKWQGEEGLKLYIQVRWLLRERLKTHTKGRKPSERKAVAEWLKLNNKHETEYDSYQSRYRGVKASHPVLKKALESFTYDPSIQRVDDLDTYLFSVFPHYVPDSVLVQESAPNL